MPDKYFTAAMDAGGDPLTKEQAIHMASEHAYEATRLINETALKLNVDSSGAGYLFRMQMAQSHAQTAAAYAAIAEATAWTEPLVT